MISYQNYLTTKRECNDARQIVGLIGKAQRTTAKAVGTLHTIDVKATIHHQETDGAKNYHDSNALNSALTRAARDLWPQLLEAALVHLTKREQDALLKCKEDIEQASAEIAKIEASL